jgi:hypothetical protein
MMVHSPACLGFVSFVSFVTSKATMMVHSPASPGACKTPSLDLPVCSVA